MDDVDSEHKGCLLGQHRLNLAPKGACHHDSQQCVRNAIDDPSNDVPECKPGHSIYQCKAIMLEGGVSFHYFFEGYYLCTQQCDNFIRLRDNTVYSTNKRLDDSLWEFFNHGPYFFFTLLTLGRALYTVDYFV